MVEGVAGLEAANNSATAGSFIPPLSFGIPTSPIMETSLRQSLLISRGNFNIFINRPICAVLIGLTVAFLLWPLVRGGKSGTRLEG